MKEIVETLIEWALKDIGNRVSLETEYEEFQVQNYGNVIFKMIGTIIKLHQTEKFVLSSLYLLENGILNMLIISSLVFHSLESVQMEALKFMASLPPFSLASLSFFLHSSHVMSDNVQIYLFSKAIPAFISSAKDPFITVSGVNAVAQLSDISLQITFLYHIWELYPRVWPKLRALLGATMHKWRLSIIKDERTEQTLSAVIRYYSLFDHS